MATRRRRPLDRCPFLPRLANRFGTLYFQPADGFLLHQSSPLKGPTRKQISRSHVEMAYLGRISACSSVHHSQFVLRRRQEGSTSLWGPRREVTLRLRLVAAPREAWQLGCGAGQKQRRRRVSSGRVCGPFFAVARAPLWTREGETGMHVDGAEGRYVFAKLVEVVGVAVVFDHGGRWYGGWWMAREPVCCGSGGGCLEHVCNNEWRMDGG